MELKNIIVIALILLIIYMLSPEITHDIENFSETNSIVNQTTNSVNTNTNANQDKSIGMDDDLKIPFSYKNATYGDNYFLDDGYDGSLGLISSFCSKSCCTEQYPLPFELPDDKLVKASGLDYVQTSYTCNNGFQDTGCVCMTKKQAEFLGSRGLNASTYVSK